MNSQDARTVPARQRDRQERFAQGRSIRQLTAAERIELRRKLWHLAPGFFPFVYAVVPHSDPLIAISYLVLVLVAAIVSLMFLVHIHYFARDGEKSILAAVVGYVGTVLATLFLFPAQPEFGFVVLTVLAFGDGIATLGGVFLESRPLPWNSRKTWAGFLSFFVLSAPMATLAYWMIARPSVPWTSAAVCGFSAAAAGALAESLPLRLNDNFRVGLAAAMAVVLAGGIQGLQ